MKCKLLLALLIVVGNTIQAQSNNEDIVWARVEELSDAVFGSKDSTVIKSLVSKKLTYGHSGGNIEDMAAMVHGAATSATVYKNRSIEKLSIFFVNNTAVVRYIFRAGSVDKGVETPLNLSLLQVWAKEQKKWKLVARQAVKVSPK